MINNIDKVRRGESTIIHCEITININKTRVGNLKAKLICNLIVGGVH